MRGYLLHHWSGQDTNGYYADIFHNDPYVWHVPYLWSFCHMGSHPKVEPGTVILWLTELEGGSPFCCDLVFVVGEVLPLIEAMQKYAPGDALLAQTHFQQGLNNHEEAIGNFTCIADMKRSYIPHPPVPIQDAVDRARRRFDPQSQPLSVSWATRKPLLRFEMIDDLVQYVEDHAQHRYRGPLPNAGAAPSAQGHSHKHSK